VFADNLIPLAIAMIVAALVILGLAVFVLRKLSAAGDGLAGLADQLDDTALTLTERVEIARASLAEQGAAIEHTLWTMRRFDEQVDALTVSLRARRQTLDELQQTLRGARVGIERLKSAIRLIARAIELRRAFLG
jgi:chromosome segregation ATPase